MSSEEPTSIRFETLRDSVALVAASGRIGWDAEAKILDKLVSAVGERGVVATVVLDLGGVRFIDSAGVSALLALRRELNTRRIKLAFREVPPRIGQMFELVGMYRLIPIVGDLDKIREAVTS